jgi:small subunit ribosomal protein S20
VPNTKQASKRNRQRDKRRIANRLVLGSMRTAIKRAREAVVAGAPEAPALLTRAISTIDKAVTKGSLHRRTASRYISRLVKSSGASA